MSTRLTYIGLVWSLVFFALFSTVSRVFAEDKVVATVDRTEIHYSQIGKSDTDALYCFGYAHGRLPAANEMGELEQMRIDSETLKLSELIEQELLIAIARDRNVLPSDSSLRKSLSEGKEMYRVREKMYTDEIVIRSIEALDKGQQPDEVYETVAKRFPRREDWNGFIVRYRSPVELKKLKERAARPFEEYVTEYLPTFRRYVLLKNIPTSFDDEIRKKEPGLPAPKTRDLVDGVIVSEHWRPSPQVDELFRRRKVAFAEAMRSHQIVVLDHRYDDVLTHMGLVPATQPTN